MSNVKEMRIFSAEQIIVQDDFPKILKDFTKEIIRKNPDDITKFGREYFEQVLKERGYFDDHLEKLQVDAKEFIFRVNEKVHDHYYITGMIGNPYDSKARLGVHQKSGIERAIKVVDKSNIDNLDEYKRKIELVKNLDHPNIAKYLEYFEDDTSFYFVSEYLQGGDLWDAVMNFGGHYTEEVAATVIKQILQSLVYLHKRGIVHRNIRTGNILFTETGKLHLKVIDFDVAGTKTLEASNVYGGKGGIHGPYYCAPEIFKNEYLDKSDVWSVGIVLYFLLFGDLPFQGATFEDAIRNIQRGLLDIDGPKNIIGQKLSIEVRDLLRKLLHTDHHTRFSAEEALHHNWFSKAQKGELKGKDLGNTLDNIRQFTAGGKLKQALLGFFTTKLMSQAEINKLAQEFQLFDSQGEGYLSYEDLREALFAVKGVDLNEKELKEIIKKIDADENGKINYAEFLMVAMNKEQLLTSDRLEAAFKMFDKNGDNEVSVEEIKEMFQNVKSVDEKMILRAMNEVDRRNRTSLKFHEFKLMIEKLFE
ncbi:protein kinase domain containing protein [Stylonychia lemnae]|uniref:Protein kinase domain containing protein n=1 Tax=Stylonychia lemnae TaxID=5949 RepID=A0A078A7Z9_STYLE|nr:protein kinase domain containing protein [Stylonychia lemnae]|eukprot:CDW76891.1 protein kinase domain containing protein [Stylonychia lemnae]